MNESEPRPPVGGLSCPRHLNDEAKKEWRRVVHDLAAVGLLARVDRSALEAYCAAYATYKKAQEEVEEKGVTVTGAKGGVIRNPAVTVAQQSLTLMHKFMVEFGMTPSSRSRLKAEPLDKEKSLAEMLFDGVQPGVDEDEE